MLTRRARKRDFFFFYIRKEIDGRMQIDEVRTGRSRKIGKEGNKIFDGEIRDIVIRRFEPSNNVSHPENLINIFLLYHTTRWYDT